MRYLIALLILLIAGCSSKNPLERQQLNLNLPADPATLDPRKGGDIVSSMLHFFLYDGLTRMRGNGSVELSLANKVELSEDLKTYTFTLREAYWSDGQPITAYDFEHSWRTILQPHFPAANAHLFYIIKNAESVKRGLLPQEVLGVQAKDDKTLVVELNYPTPYFLKLVSFCVFFPIHYDESTLYSGPFVLQSWKHNDQILLEKNPHYHQARDIPIETIRLTMIENETTALEMFKKGELDMLGEPFTTLPNDAIPELKKQGLLCKRPISATTICSFNIECPPFNNKNIRRAFALAIDRLQIVQSIGLGEEPALNCIPSNLRTLKPKNYFQDADIAKARTLFDQGLKELGLTKETFPQLVYCYTRADLQHKVSQILQQQWQNAFGICIDLQNNERKILMQKLKSRDYQIAQSCWIAQYPDPMNILERFKYKDNVKNYPGWENAAFIERLNRSSEVLTADERETLLEEAEEILLEEMPLAPVFHWSAAFVAQDYLKDLNLSLIGNGYFEEICDCLKARNE